jgi:hypothetical protein
VDWFAPAIPPRTTINLLEIHPMTNGFRKILALHPMIG